MKFIRPIVITSMLLSTLPAFADTTVTASLPKDGGQACANKCGFDSKLQLTPEQREKLGSLRDQYTLSTASKKAELEVAHNELRRVFGQPTIDKQAALALQNKINGLKDDLSNQRLNMMLASSDVFTPEQRAQFAKMHAEGAWGHHGHHRGMGREGGREGSRERGGKIG
ncbi:MAG: Spy/CpxP family protein refolding chaperone [Cyanobacteria bacterium REEB67]|nr:Spy/CpxP family protein refolding chaperone [Cyanobacteria bacterium REEB67]